MANIKIKHHHAADTFVERMVKNKNKILTSTFQEIKK